MNMRSLFGCTALLGLMLCTTSAFAGWTVTHLDPPGGTYGDSRAYGVSGGQQAGDVYMNGHGNRHASLWSGTAASWVDLNPSGCSWSVAFGASDGQQVGYAMGPATDLAHHAGLWSGTAASFVDLNPLVDTYCYSLAYGVAAGQQVGYAYIDNALHAALWRATAGSFVDLNPAGSTWSEAFGVSADGQQAGYARIGGKDHAALWNGTAGNFVDLNPVGSSESHAHDAADGQQVGHAKFGSDASHAALWSGTASSFVDLNPVGSTYSEAYAAADGWQVGIAGFGGNRHAALWHGTSGSWVNLESLLGAGYMSSEAHSIEVVGSDIWVAGYAHESVQGISEAILWHYAPDVVPEPSSLLALGSSLLALGGLIRRRR